MKPGINACQQFLQDGLKFRNMADQMKAAGKDENAVRALKSNADLLMRYAKSAIEAPQQFSNSYLKNEMFAGEFVSAPTLGGSYLVFDSSRPPFDDL